MKHSSQDRTGEKPDNRRGDGRAKGEGPRKRIVICADGTWNDPEDKHPTNVMRIARAIRPEDAKGVQQVVFYDWGVGSYHARLRGGVWGLGLAKNIQDGYRFIVQNYDEGDELFLFGFSRGAYTVRALAGFLNKCGILGRDRAHQIPDAFKYYKKRRDKPGSKEARKWRQDHCVKNRGRVRFLGVWDTVGALGIPTRVLGFVEEQDLFYDPVLGSYVEVARHAVAIDEKRADFAPTLWIPNEGDDGEKKREPENVKQVWFAGSHGDVGGGRPRDGKTLSHLALEWMAAEAAEHGLALESHVHCDTSGLHRVRTQRTFKPLWRVARGTRRREVPKDALVHESVKCRHYAHKTEKGKKRNGYDPTALRSWLEANGGWENDSFVPWIRTVAACGGQCLDAVGSEGRSYSVTQEGSGGGGGGQVDEKVQ